MANLVDANDGTIAGSSSGGFNWNSLIDPLTNTVAKVVDYEIFKKNPTTKANEVTAPGNNTTGAGNTDTKRFLLWGAIAAGAVVVALVVKKLFFK